MIESTFIPLELKFEHRLYLPSIGFYLALVLGVKALLKRWSFIKSLRVENKFKKTEIGNVPVDWNIVKIKDIISLNYGKGFPEDKREDALLAEIKHQTDVYNNTPQGELGGLTPDEAFQRNRKNSDKKI